MSRELGMLAAALTALALFLAGRRETFTRVTVDGRTVRMLVAGTGSPTVVFENGLGPPLEIWGEVQPEVSRFARTVSYDRAGVGLSARGPLPRDGLHIAAELHRALRAASIAPPYILVGHSFGGPCIRVFAGLYPSEVAGMILVDPMHEGEGLPGHSTLAERVSVSATLGQAQNSAIPPGVPVSLIVAMGSTDVPFMTPALRDLRLRRSTELRADSLALGQWMSGVPDGRLLVTTFSGHNVPVEQPELVIETIRHMVLRIDAQRPAARDPS